MRIEIYENKNRLTYKVNSHELPMNSAIREYKHPSDIGVEGWRDLINESNGDVLEVTYIGTSAGYKLAIAQAPQTSRTFSLKFIDAFDQQVIEFQRNFEKWVADLKSSKAYEFAGSQSIDPIDFSALQKYSAIELGNQLNKIGTQLLSRLFPEKMDNVAEVLSSHKKNEQELSAKKVKLEQALQEIEDESKKGHRLKPDNTMIQNIENQFVEELVVTVTDIERKMGIFRTLISEVDERQGHNEIVTDTEYDKIIRQIILDLKNSLEDFWTAISEISSDVENGPFPEKSVEKILNNVSTGKAKVMAIALQTEPVKDGFFAEEMTKNLKHASQLIENGTLENQIVEILVGNTVRLVVYLAQVTFCQVIVNVENIQKNQVQLAEQKRHQEVLKERETIDQQLVVLKRQLTHEENFTEWLSSILELKRSMPVMSDLGE
ncbi:hypothetical protein [Levilactobacillus sp. N40-8-2]|uniref:hypothetical protein n=1 Tax=Levilactobacillus muriae TaxID=3238987 RepID=UPI0038B3CDCB